MARLLILTDEQVEAFKKVFEINLQYDDAVVLTTERAIEGTDVTKEEVEEYVKDYLPDGLPDVAIEWAVEPNNWLFEEIIEYREEEGEE